MQVRVLWLGRPAASPFESQVETYRKRVMRRWPAEDLPLRPHAGGRASDPRRALREEAESVRNSVPRGWPMVVLDETGNRLTSERFAHFLETVEETAVAGAVFVIGSDLGVAEELRREARAVISLSDMTLPHLLARLILWEQLFRAADILSGGGYHRPR